MILIGAVALAFIVLGVVVVFNGVLYTETLSSADTGQTASSADATELEVRQGVACLANTDDEDDPGRLFDSNGLLEGTNDDELDREIENYTKLYRNATAHSRPAAVTVTYDSGTIPDFFNDGVTIAVEYDSSDLSYERTLNVTADECPRSPSIEEFSVNPTDDGNYTVDWGVRSSHSDLSSMNVSLYDDEEVIDSTTENFEDENEAAGSLELGTDDDEGDFIRITVNNDAGYVATESESVEAD